MMQIFGGSAHLVGVERAKAQFMNCIRNGLPSQTIIVFVNLTFIQVTPLSICCLHPLMLPPFIVTGPAPGRTWTASGHEDLETFSARQAFLLGSAHNIGEFCELLPRLGLIHYREFAQRADRAGNRMRNS
jgi:hypothetical protein